MPLNTNEINITALSLNEANCFYELSDSNIFDVLEKHYFTSSAFLNYLASYHANDFSNHSFVIWRNETPLAVCLCAPTGKALSLFGSHIRLLCSNILEPETKRIVTKLAINEISKLFDNRKYEGLEFQYDSLSSSFLYKHNPTIRSSAQAVVDLSLSAESLKSNLRKSYKSLVNWGSKNLNVLILDQKSISKTQFNTFQELHIQAAGRATRSTDSWEKQYDAITQEKAFLVLAYLGSNLVSGVYTVTGDEDAYYGVAASNRALMKENLPLNHFPLFESILHAKSKGISKYILGTLDSNSKKEDTIAKFKAGFRTNVEILNSLSITFN